MIDIKEMHEFDGPILGFYAKGDHDLFKFIDALDHYGALDYAEECGPLVESINWEWWRWVPTGDPDMPLEQAYAKMVPSQGAFLATVFWCGYAADLFLGRNVLETKLKLMAGQHWKGEVL